MEMSHSIGWEEEDGGLCAGLARANPKRPCISKSRSLLRPDESLGYYNYYY